ncbi:MAG TPA: class I SAM-dependent methyltransferase [Anaeromyxobacteraceae bacterium]|jgi:tellurite methyltransferase|nr:class I SAM-dependent methyltransferase [Anaeromyxobacteraceae bacterium]
MPGSVEFFERQFQRQVAQGEYALNPFEQDALPHLNGRLLDFGCGLGNLSLEAARRGCTVVAVDGSPTAVERVRRAAAAEKLPVEAVRAELAGYRPEGLFDSVAAIGILMFFPEPRAHELLARLQSVVAPGGVLAATVLVQGTTFLDVFGGTEGYLFRKGELEERFAGWELLLSKAGSFPSPDGRVKEFESVVARRAA